MCRKISREKIKKGNESRRRQFLLEKCRFREKRNQKETKENSFLIGDLLYQIQFGAGDS